MISCGAATDTDEDSRRRGASHQASQLPLPLNLSVAQKRGASAKKIQRRRFSEEERRLLWTALRSLKGRYRTWHALTVALSIPISTLFAIGDGRGGSVEVAARAAALAGVPVSDLLSGERKVDVAPMTREFRQLSLDLSRKERKPPKPKAPRHRFSNEHRRLLVVALRSLKRRLGTWPVVAMTLDIPLNTLFGILGGRGGSFTIAQRVAAFTDLSVNILLSKKLTIAGRCFECGKPFTPKTNGPVMPTSTPRRQFVLVGDTIARTELYVGRHRGYKLRSFSAEHRARLIVALKALHRIHGHWTLVARALGMTRSGVEHILYSNRAGSIDLLARSAVLLNLTLEQMLRGVHDIGKCPHCGNPTA